MGRGAGPCLAALLRRAAARRRKPEGYAGAHPALLRSGDPSLRAARRAHAGRSPRQFTARADHGAGKIVAEGNSGARTRHRRADHLPPQRRCHRGVEARSGGVVVGWAKAHLRRAHHRTTTRLLVSCMVGTLRFVLPTLRTTVTAT